MHGCSPSPNLARILFFTTIFIFGLLVAVSVWNCVTYYTPNGSSSSTETTTLIGHPLVQDNGPQSQYKERGIVPSPISDIMSNATMSLKAGITGNPNGPYVNASSNGQSDTAFSSEDQPISPITAEPEPASSEIASLSEKLESLLDGVIPLAAPSIIREATSQAQALEASVQAIATDIASMANQVEVSELQASDALKTAEGMLESLNAAVGSIAKNVTPTSGFPMPILDELSQAVSSDLDDIVKVANGPVSLIGDLIEDNGCETTTIIDGIPSTVVGLCGDMVSVTSHSASAFIIDSPTPDTRILTAEVSLSTTFPTSANTPSGATVLTSPTLAPSTSAGPSLPLIPPVSASQTITSASQNTGGSSDNETGNQMSTSSEAASPAGMSRNNQTVASASNNPVSNPVTGESSLTTIPRPTLTASVKPGIGVSSRVTTTGTDEIVTITESIFVTEECALPPVRSVFLVGQTSTLTVYAYNQCPTLPSCPECTSPTCHCPEAGGAPLTTPPSGGSGSQGPCPGSGYTCDDCLDGWFCPPPQTPAQSAPCGFGWPCGHCDGGWFCVPHPTQGPDTCSESGGPTTNGTTNGAGVTTFISTSTSTFTVTVPTQPSGSSPNQPHPIIPDRASGWDYCGCWADQPEQQALNMEPHLNLGPLRNLDCVQHCIGRGYLMAGTENGSECYCGNFLNGTQKLDDSVCSTPCSGDPRQACGGSNALCCYSSDGKAHGWASAGPQPLPATLEPPEVMSMVVGGVAQSIVTEPYIVYPGPGADMSQLVSQFRQKTRQPEGQMPSGMGVNSAPCGGGGQPPGFPTNSLTAGGGAAPGHGTAQSSNSNGGASPGTPGGGSNTPMSPSNNGGTELPSNGQTPGVTSTPGGEAGGSTGNGGGQTTPLSGQGQGTEAPNPADNTSNNSGNPNQTPTGQGQSTTGPSPTGSPFGNGGSSGQTSPGQCQGTQAPNPTNNGGIPNQSSAQDGTGSNPTQNPSNNGGIPNTCAPDSTDPICTASDGWNPGSNSAGQGQGPGSSLNGGTAAPNPASNGGRLCSIGSNDPSCTSIAGSGDSSTPASPSQGQGATSGSNDGTANPPTGAHASCAPGSKDPACSASVNQPTASSPNSGPSGGSSCTAGSTDPNCTSPSNEGNSMSNGSQGQGTGRAGSPTNAPTTTNPPGNGGGSGLSGQGQGTGSNPEGINGPNTKGQGTQSNPNGGAGNATPTIEGSNPTPNPAVTNGGNTPTGDGQSTTSDRGTGPNAASGNPQLPSYTFPPGVVPYGPSPSMTTLIAVVVWEPGGDKTPATMMRDDIGSQVEPSDTPGLEFEQPPTTITSTSMLPDPRWQRIRPVAIW